MVLYDGGSEGDAYTVVTDTLLDAARVIYAVSDRLTDGTAVGLPVEVTTGHARLQEAVAGFCAGWSRGVGRLTQGTDGAARRLHDTASGYLGTDLDAMLAFQDLSGRASERGGG